MQEDDSQPERECPGDGRGDRLAAHVVDRHQRKRQNPGGNATQQHERPECEQVGDVRMEKAVDRRARHQTAPLVSSQTARIAMALLRKRSFAAARSPRASTSGRYRNNPWSWPKVASSAM